MLGNTHLLLLTLHSTNTACLHRSLCRSSATTPGSATGSLWGTRAWRSTRRGSGSPGRYSQRSTRHCRDGIVHLGVKCLSPASQNLCSWEKNVSLTGMSLYSEVGCNYSDTRLKGVTANGHNGNYSTVAEAFSSDKTLYQGSTWTGEEDASEGPRHRLHLPALLPRGGLGLRRPPLRVPRPGMSGFPYIRVGEDTFEMYLRYRYRYARGCIFCIFQILRYRYH